MLNNILQQYYMMSHGQLEPVSKPQLSSNELIYNGNLQIPIFSNYNSEYMTMSGQINGIDAGTYTAIFIPNDGYCWEDGTQEEFTVTWIIDRAIISSIPSQDKTLSYTGSKQAPVWTGFDSDKMTISGVTESINAGTFNALFTPTANYKWSDGTVAAKIVQWKINKVVGSISINKTDLSLNNSEKTGIITVTRAGNGTVTATSGDSNVATVSVSGTRITVTAKKSGSTTITVKVAEGTNHTAPASKTVSVTVVIANVFGVCWDMNSSSTALTRLTPSNDPNGLVSVNLTTNPAPAIGTGAGSSPFDSYSPWKDMEEYNIINNAVSHKRGNSGFSRTNYNTVVYIPTFYYRIFDNGSKRYFYISDKEITGFTKHPGSNKYVGRYNTSVTSSTIERVVVIGAEYHTTISNRSPRASLTRAQFRTFAKGKGNKWGLYDYATWCAIWLLYLIEFADWDSQAKIGMGVVDTSAAQNTGGTDTMSYHTGRAVGTDGQTAVQYRHIENLWGNVCEWIDGVNFNGDAVYICTDPTKYADDATTDYVQIGRKGQFIGFIGSLGLSSNAPWTFFPMSLGEKIPDMCQGDGSGWTVFASSGFYAMSNHAGLFCFYANMPSSYSSAEFGARLLFHP